MREGGRKSRGLRRWALAAFLLSSGGPAVAADPEPELHEAISRLRTVVEKAKAAERGDKELQLRLREEFALLASRTSAVRAWVDETESVKGTYVENRRIEQGLEERHSYAMGWNDLLTLAQWHGVPPAKPRPMCYGRKVLASHDLAFLSPIGNRWTISWPGEDQRKLVLKQRGFGGVELRTVSVDVYKWNTTYSGVEGENAQKLAESLWKFGKALYSERSEASRGVEVRKLNAKILRSYYYFAKGVDSDTRRLVRSQNWLFKGKRHTYAIELMEELDEGFAQLAVDKWLQSDACPETAAVLESFAFIDG